MPIKKRSQRVVISLSVEFEPKIKSEHLYVLLYFMSGFMRIMDYGFWGWIQYEI